MSTEPRDLRTYRILVGVDGSEGGAAAVRYAAEEAKRTSTGLMLVHVIPDYAAMSPMLPLIPSELDEAGRAILAHGIAAAEPIVGAEHIETTLMTGPRARSLVRAAEHARLIVLGREVRSPLARLVTGATTIGVAARSTCPTIAVPPGWTPGTGQARVVVGLKSTTHSRALLRRAFLAAADGRTGLVIVHAWEVPVGYDDLVARPQHEQEWSDHLVRQIEPQLTEWREAYPQVTVELRVVHGQPARMLCDASEEADLLVLARRLHGIPGGHLGATGRALLRESACPTEIVPLGVGAGFESDLVLERAGAAVT